MPDTTPFSEIANLTLDTQVIARRIVTFDEIDSTNTYALEQGRVGEVYVADRQTLGRGRLGRTWHSAPGLGLWFTVALDGLLDGLTFAAALSVRDALKERCAPAVKWPNDILIHGKKVCGILTEHREGRTAIGIGINVHHRMSDFPEELQDKAGSLATETSGAWNRADVLRDVLTHLDKNIILLKKGDYAAVHAEWVAACGLTGRRVRCGAHTGIVETIDPQGALILNTSEGPQRVVSGDLIYLNGD